MSAPTNSIKFRCMHCNKKMAVPNHWGGQRVKCPICSAANVVPFFTSTDAAPTLDANAARQDALEVARKQALVAQATANKTALRCERCDHLRVLPGRGAICEVCHTMVSLKTGDKVKIIRNGGLDFAGTVNETEMTTGLRTPGTPCMQIVVLVDGAPNIFADCDIESIEIVTL
jgi:phage FluMu protein Com